MSIERFLRLSAHLQMLPILEGGEETLIGGQAVMEGVMMLAPHSCCIAVRKPDGRIITEEKPVQKVSERYPILRWPVLRGLGRIGQTMALGSHALKFSFNQALAEEAAKTEAKPPSKVSSWMMTGSLIFSVLAFLFLYKFVPLFLATSLGHAVPALSGRFAVNMMDGAIRIVIFLAYLLLLSRPKDIQRVFQYHGAEHKAVFNFESGKPLSVENAQKFTTFHPRCGTCFLLVMLVIAAVIYALFPVDGFLAKFFLRIACLPLIVGLSYELIRLAARRQGRLLGMLTAPGLWLQRITTKPPDDSQAAVAIHALNCAMTLEAQQGGELVVA
ncbi:MAG TPA: DUF1385 domain-containing protein [Bryobacteraceae bacterium]|nr:DUF1385 domain-containing protein [Bryobacteraceae bacterium]